MKTTGLVRVIRFVTTHPLTRRHKARAIWRFARWQVASRLWPEKLVASFAGDARLLVSRGMVGATGNVYCGLHEFEDMALVLHALRPDDLFLDVGANVGSYTVLAAAVAKARVIAFEPVPSTFAHLLDNIRLNGLDHRVDAHNEGVGREPGIVRFTTELDAANHIVTEAEAQAAPGKKTVGAIEVPMVRLDDLPDSVRPTLIKIDVEGFETPVLEGAQRMLNSPELLALLMELSGNGARYGFDEEALHRRMLEWGFRPCRYSPTDRQLHLVAERNTSGGNTLYVRDLRQLTERVRTAPAVRVLDATI